MTTKVLTIIIPVRSEAETIEATLLKLTQSVHTPHSVFVVDDHVSPMDITRDIVLHYQKQYKNIYWITKNQYDADGFGPALCRGVKFVRTPYTIFVMADGCDDTNDIDTMVNVAKTSSFDVICGCRYMKGGRKVGGPLLQHICSFFLNYCLSFLGIGTRDATNAFKLYKTSFLRSIIPKRALSGVEFSLQLTIEGYRKHGNYKDISTIWRGRTKGISKVKLIIRGPKYIVLLIKAVSAKCQL